MHSMEQTDVLSPGLTKNCPMIFIQKITQGAERNLKTLSGFEKDKQYRVFDYVNDKEVGKISGENSELQVSFENYLLLKY